MTPVLTRRNTLRAGAASVLSSAWIRTARADESGTLTVALSNNPVTCDPINMSSHDTQILSQTIYDNLVEFDIDGTLRPQLAKALPEISKDSLVYTFDLRDDVLFQDGTPMTSEDVKYSFEYMLNPANKATRMPIFLRLSHVVTDGPHRVHVHLKEPYAPWTAFLLTTPLISNCTESIGKHGLFREHGGERLYQWDQPLVRHRWDQVIKHAALAEQRMGAPFGGVRLELAIISKRLASGPKQCEQRNGERIQQPQTVAPPRRTDSDRSHPHAEARVLGVAKAAFDAPALAIQTLQGTCGGIGEVGGQAPRLLHVLVPYAQHGANLIAFSRHQGAAQQTRPPARPDPVGRGARLTVRRGHRDVAAKADHIIEFQFLTQHAVELLIAKPRSATMHTLVSAGRASASRTRT